jgi:hypothetical protein
MQASFSGRTLRGIHTRKAPAYRIVPLNIAHPTLKNPLNIAHSTRKNESECTEEMEARAPEEVGNIRFRAGLVYV